MVDTLPAVNGAHSPMQPLTGDTALISRLQALLGAPVEIVAELGSTNDELVRRALADSQALALPDMSLLVTDYQNAGKGRLDRTWEVRPGEALTFSLLLRPVAVPPETYGWFTMLMSCAVTQALRDHGLAAQTKWPNDVLVGTRKITGILAALVVTPGAAPAVVVGTGLNVSTTHLPVETATSVQREGCNLGRADLLVDVLEKFLPLYRRFCADPTELTVPDGRLRTVVESQLGTLGQRVRAELPGAQAPLTGRAVGLDDHGALLIRPEGGRVRAVSAGDVVHLRPTEERS